MVKMANNLTILLVAMKNDYGKQEHDGSYEWNHFYLGIRDHFQTVAFFDYIHWFQQDGQVNMQKRLLETVQQGQFDIIVFSLHRDEFEPGFVNSLRQYSKTLSYFPDATWRESYVATWAPQFDAYTSTDPLVSEKHKNKYSSMPIYAPFGVNTELFCKSDGVAKDIDVSFIGAYHPHREWVLKKLKRAGISVQVFGHGWPNGFVTDKQMIDIFRRSKISINLSNSISYDARYLLSSPRALINTLRSPKRIEQLKGRHFEIPACKSLQMSYFIDGLESMFHLGKEMVVYLDPEDLIKKINFYLNHDDVRDAMCERAYLRVQQEHNYASRFKELFTTLGWCQ